MYDFLGQPPLYLQIKATINVHGDKGTALCLKVNFSHQVEVLLKSSFCDIYKRWLFSKTKMHFRYSDLKRSEVLRLHKESIMICWPICQENVWEFDASIFSWLISVRKMICVATFFGIWWCEPMRSTIHKSLPRKDSISFSIYCTIGLQFWFNIRQLYKTSI